MLQAFLGLVVGIAGVEFLTLPMAFWVWLCAWGILTLAFPRLWVVALFALLGWARYATWTDLPREESSNIAHLRAIGVQEPTRRGVRVLCRFVDPPIQAYALVYFRQDVANPPDFGDEFRLNARWYRPRNWAGTTFDWARYLERRRVHHLTTVYSSSQFEYLESGEGRWQRRFSSARQWLRQRLRQQLSREDSALVEGMMLGATGDFPPDLRERFHRSGIGHLLATSGLHVGIVLWMVLRTLRMLGVPYRWQVGLTLLMVWCYALLAGMRPSIVRAGIMATAFLNAPLLRREIDSLSALGTAGTIWLLIAPHALFEVGFQYSFTAVLTILLFYHRLVRRLRFLWKRSVSQGRVREWGHRALCPLLSVTLCAQAGIAPVQLYHFGYLSLLSPVANLLAVPIAYPILAFGFFFWLSNGMGVLPLELCCAWLKGVAHLFSPDWGLLQFSPSLWLVLSVYAFLILLTPEPPVVGLDDEGRER